MPASASASRRLSPPRLPRGRVTLTVALATVVHLVAQTWALFAVSPPLTGFRTFVSGDQLGYLAIVTEVAQGHLDRFEPYTETGVNTYPRGYYVTVGLVARLLGLSPVTAWNGVALALQATMVAVLAVVVVRLTRLPWAALCVPLVFLTGPFAWLFQPGMWRLTFDSHSTIWGPYGTTGPLNAETAGLALGGITLGLLALAWLLPSGRAARVSLTVIAAAIVGATANGQTYSFLALVYVVAALLATATLVATRQWLWLGLSAALLVLVYAVGPAVAEALGQLPTLVFGLLPFVPGMVVLALRGGWWIWGTAPLVAAAAMPQIWTTVSDLRAENPFLLYRVASNQDLGVDFWQGLISGTPVLLPLIGLLALGIARRSPVLVALGGAMPVVWLYLATNDLWGANAEPYRFWIEGFQLGGVVLVIGLALALAPSRAGHPLTHGDAARISPRPARVLAGVWLALVVLSLPDYVTWVGDKEVQDVWDPRTSRMEAITAAAAGAEDGRLVLPDSCVDPQTLKVVSGLPLSYYRLGMAWPQDKDAVDDALVATTDGLTGEIIDAAGIGWVLTDSGCGDPVWLDAVRGDLVTHDTRAYQPATGFEASAHSGEDDGGEQRITLWRVER